MVDGSRNVTKKVPHNVIALNAMHKIAGLGISPAIQQRIGAFAVYWGLFESNLEPLVWALRNETVKGVRPSTDSTSVNEWIGVLKLGNAALPSEANEVLRRAAVAAENLMNYRHSLFHGALVAFPGAASASFIRNPRWNGEVRKRPVGDAHVSENLLDMAIEAGWILLRVVLTARELPENTAVALRLKEMDRDVRRADSLAGELRHLVALMNHEKY